MKDTMEFMLFCQADAEFLIRELHFAGIRYDMTFRTCVWTFTVPTKKRDFVNTKLREWKTGGARRTAMMPPNCS